MVQLAKIFKNGASQAVRLPKEFRFEDETEVCIERIDSVVVLYPKAESEGDELCIKQVGSAVLMFPKKKAWGLMREAIEQMDEDFMADRNQPKGPDKREGL